MANDNLKNLSVDLAAVKMLKKANEEGISTIWNRYEKMQPHCGFGELGICCSICNMGPCRIDPFSVDIQMGACGAGPDVIASRNLVRRVAAGAAAHSDHGRDIAHTLLLAASGKAIDYAAFDTHKLMSIAEELGIKCKGLNINDVAVKVAEILLSQMGNQFGEILFTKRAPEKQIERWRNLGIMPRGIDREIVELLHRTHIGVDSDYKNIIYSGFKAAIADGWGGSMIATELSDVLLGSPKPIRAIANLGVLEEKMVNIIVHGHEPTLSAMVVKASKDKDLINLAKEKGAEGINIAGMCCTANEILMRQGLPVAGNFLQQELAIITGAVEAMIVDVQCIIPASSGVAKCYHTKLITTSDKAKIKDAEHIQFDEKNALEIAKRIVNIAIENFPNRRKDLVDIPNEKMDLVAGFTPENTFRFLGGRFRATYRPLNDAIISGRIRGVAGVVGCNNPRICHDYGHLTLVKELIKNDVLVVQTGCSAIASGKAGLLKPEAAFEYAGNGLREICEAVGIPPVLHMGSCVDNSRILIACCEMVKEGGIGDDISELPVAASAPEAMSEKAVAISFYAVASGIFTVYSPQFNVFGSKNVVKFLCDELNGTLGASFAFEDDPVKTAELMINHINSKRAALKLKPVMYENEENIPQLAEVSGMQKL